MEHSSSNCQRRPWNNRELPHRTPESLGRDQQANLHVPGRSALTGANTGHDSRNHNFDYRESGRQPHARFNKRYNQRYSPPVFPPTPSLNNSFPEGLSKSLLQIAENQLRTIEAMKASQEAQAAAYKEMTKTNKMRDDDALFTPLKFMMDQTPQNLKNG